MAAVQFTFTQKQYIEQHNETEYTEQNIHNNKNTTKQNTQNRTYITIKTEYTEQNIHNNKNRIHRTEHT